MDESCKSLLHDILLGNPINGLSLILSSCVCLRNHIRLEDVHFQFFKLWKVVNNDVDIRCMKRFERTNFLSVDVAELAG